MKRIASLTIPLGVLLGLTMGATSADAGSRHHVRGSCETRIFQREDQACFKDGEEYFWFRRGLTPDRAALAVEEQAGGFTVNGLDCGCQLRRRYDIICAGGDGGPILELRRASRSLAVIGYVDRRGRRIVGEAFSEGDQTKYSARRVALEECEIANEK